MGKKKTPVTPINKTMDRAPLVAPVVPDREMPVTGGDLPEEPVTMDVADPETAAPGRGEPPRESDETF